MKVIRVPWIRCRADELGSVGHEMQWRKRGFTILAYSEKEACEWWSAFCEAERDELLGIGGGDGTEQASLF